MGSLLHDSYVEELVLKVLEMDNDQLRVVLKAISLRRSQLAEAKAFENQLKLYVGDEVRIIGNLTPKWCVGETGRITRLDSDKVKIDLTSPHWSNRTNSSTRFLTVGYSHVEKL